ncbi:hypothetical protein SAY87_011710 [Trapa incisa]|uniref:Protein SMG7L-like n=1 Tax=Trapa incisa TaxID=236973 RepID=A0AAN7GR72_9MYRT|nr:hypothetical protein SAY87_011710 [Trapa incisa]
MERSFSAQHERAKSNLLVEASNMEKQFWALVNSKGLLQPEVQNLYRRVCSCYEGHILTNLDVLNFQEVEYSLWKLHYKYINEFRRQIKKGSDGCSIHVEGLKIFLLSAMEFYKSLLLKLRSQSVEKVWTEQDHPSQFLCHRILICLGDFARYRELYEKDKVEAKNWSIAAGYYLESSKLWPESGNPHNQLALLATYIGDEFLALYNCVRSLAIKEPFPDAWKNLLLILEKSRSSPLCSNSPEAPFNFLRPSERRNSCKNKTANESQNCYVESSLWPLIVRIMSFFYIKSSFHEFPITFASTVKELELLLELDDSKLETALKPYQFMEFAVVGPTRAIQVACTFIFIIHNLPENPLLQNSEGQDELLLRKYVNSSMFIFMGRLVDRCLKTHLVNSSPLLPSILIFIEWLVNVPDAHELHGSNEEERAAALYFFMSLVHLLNTLKMGKAEPDSGDYAALWEDFELRGFTPLEKSHISLDFSTSSCNMNSLQTGNITRARRILFAAKKIAERYQKWVFYDKSSGQFSATAKAEDRLITIDEEEVILFNPLTRYNSAPPYDTVTSNGQSLEGGDDIVEPIVPSDECLRRTQTSLEFKPFKQSELAAFVAPPSLSAWVLNDGSSGISIEHHLSPIKEFASASLDNLSITTSKQEEPILGTSHEPVMITHYPHHPLPYSAPLPSAPFLPENVAWDSGNPVNFLDGQIHRMPELTPHSRAGFVAYPVSQGLSSSEWLQKFREINNLNPGNNLVWAPSNLFQNFERPFDSSQMVYVSPKPVLYPEFFQRPIPYGCSGLVANPVRDDHHQLSLLQPLKEREWRLQQDPNVRGPTFLGK